MNQDTNNNLIQFGGKTPIKYTKNEHNNSIVLQTKTQPIQLTFNNVNVKTDQGEFLVKEATGTVKPGKVVALLGQSGCGKTTLINSITGLIDENLITNGQILLNNDTINSDHQSNLIAYYNQKTIGYKNVTVMTQFKYAASLYNKNSEEVANNIINYLCLTEEKEKEFEKCSTDQQVKILIAKNLTTQASIYILDEPLTGLDVFSTGKIISLIKELSNLGKAVLLSVHEPSESLFNFFDEFILMTNGSIVFQGTKEEAVKYFTSIGFVKDNFYMPYSYFFLQIIKLEKDYLNRYRNESIMKYNFLIDSWRSNAKKIEIEYNEPVNTIITKFTIFIKGSTMLMSKIFSFYFLFNIVLIIIPNIYLIYKASKYDNNDLSESNNILKVVKISKVWKIIHEHVCYKTYSDYEQFSSYETLWNENPIFIICVLLFYRFFLLSLFEFSLFYKSIENHRDEYRKKYFGVIDYLLAIYMISIREFTFMVICDVATFIYFSNNRNMLIVFIIFYLLTANFLYLTCLTLSISFNTIIFYVLSGVIKFILSNILIYYNGEINLNIWCLITSTDKYTLDNSPLCTKIRRLFVPFNVFLSANFTIKNILCDLLILLVLNLLIIILTFFKLRKTLNISLGKFN
ncbi:AB15G [Hepatospora eriocheir]|uniref:AB15G n=1 Tax=Hepatospora eriocheir TaxID=1081669 RepID=A0A1X0QDK5_9MICR|nr:AB15G [Hepatospora eriocheir]